MFTTLLVAFAAVIAGDADTVDADATAVVQMWAEAHEDVHSVHATFILFKFDSVFRTFNKTSGEVYFSSRTDGFWSFTPDSQTHLLKTVRHGNVTYLSQVASPERYIWKDDIVTVVDEKEKKYDQYRRNTPLLGTQLFSHVTDISPFLPGLPDKNAVAAWKFKIIADSEDEVRLKGTPRKVLTKRFRSCELILRKPNMTLHTIRYIDPTGRHESVLVFKTVKRNPAKAPDVDLTDYTVGHSVSDHSKP